MYSIIIAQGDGTGLVKVLTVLKRIRSAIRTNPKCQSTSFAIALCLFVKCTIMQAAGFNTTVKCYNATKYCLNLNRRNWMYSKDVKAWCRSKAILTCNYISLPHFCTMLFKKNLYLSCSCLYFFYMLFTQGVLCQCVQCVLLLHSKRVSYFDGKWWLRRFRLWVADPRVRGSNRVTAGSPLLNPRAGPLNVRYAPYKPGTAWGFRK